MTAPVRRLVPAGATAALLVTLMLVTFATIVSFIRVFGDWVFAADLVVVASVGHAVAVALRMAGGRRLPSSVAMLIGLASVGVVVAWRHLPETLWYGLPTGDTWRLAGTQLADAWRQIGVAVAPVDYLEGFALTSMLAVGGGAVIADAITFRSRAGAESLVPMGVVFLTVSIVGDDRSATAITASWLAVALLHVVAGRAARSSDGIMWMGARRSALRAWWALGAGMAIVAAALAGFMGPRLPGADAEPLLEPRVRERGGAARSLTPFVDVRGRLVNASDTVLFSVRADRPAYWRVTGLSEFDGSTWQLPPDDLEGAGGQLDVEALFVDRLAQTIVIEQLDGNLAPVAAAPTALRSSSVDLYYESDSGTLVVADPGLSNGDEYEIVSSTPNPAPEVLDTLRATRPADTVLPDNWNPRLTRLAEQVTANAPTPYRRALALQNWFRSEFTYDLTVTFRSSVDAIEEFLEARRGYCEQFAGSFAALARSIGLPARVAIGFTPGDRGADGVYRVRGRHAHAWPEVWFDGAGWIGFEPTPGRGDPSSVDHTGVEPAQDDGETPPPTTAPAAAPAITTAPGAGPSPTVRPGGSEPSVTDESTASSSGPWATIVLVAIVLVAAWIALMPTVVRRRLRRGDPDLSIVDDWNASVSAMALAGVHVSPSSTPHEAAGHMARNSGLDRHELLELATAATTVVYSDAPLPPQQSHRAALVGTHVRESAIAVVPMRWRIRARVDPRTARRFVTGR